MPVMPRRVQLGHNNFSNHCTLMPMVNDHIVGDQKLIDDSKHVQ